MMFVTSLVAYERVLGPHRRPSKVANLCVKALIEQDFVTGDVPDYSGMDEATEDVIYSSQRSRSGSDTGLAWLA